MGCRSAGWLIAIGLIGAGCDLPDDPSEPAAPAAADLEIAPAVIDVVGMPAAAVQAERPAAIYMVHDADELAWLGQEAALDPGREPEAGTDAPEPTAAAYKLFLNRRGGTYTPGNNDSRVNRSSLLGTSRTIDSWNASDSQWNQVVSCVRQLFGPFSIEVTDVDPGGTPHIEAVVAGRPADIGLAGDVGGVSPFASNCSTINNSVVFVFAEIYGSNTRMVCEVVAQEVAHSFGLDHQYLCEDPMTYLQGCGEKAFRDQESRCGEGSARDCYCGQATQNSVEMLTARVGVGDNDRLAPTVAISFPADGQAIYPGFGVYIDASDDIALDRVELLIDGNMVHADPLPPYTFSTADDLAEGEHEITTIAHDLVGKRSETTITVMVDLDADPDANQDPSAGDRIWRGGCSTGGGTDAAWLVAAIGLAAAAAARRRRSR